MANVQIDSGEFTRIANILLEQTAKLHLNGTQYSIILTVWRFTYGFQRSESELSISFIARAVETSPRVIRRELSALIERHIILVTKESTKSDSRVLKFNKDYDTWQERTNQSSGDKSDPSQGTKQSSQQGTKQSSKKEIKENSKENSLSKNKFSDSEIPLILAKELTAYIKANKPDAKTGNLQTWATEFDRMIRLDHRKVEDIRAVMNWCQNDSFWAPNIMSAGKLRSKFDTLQMRMKMKQTKSDKPKREIKM